MKKLFHAARAATGILMLSTLAVAPAHAGPTRMEDAKAKAEANARAIFQSAAVARPKDPVDAAGSSEGKRGNKPNAGGSAYSELIARYAKAEGVPVSLAHAVIRVESNFRANARGSAGEIGLMQIKPATARGMGFTGKSRELFDPETNIRWGMKYLGGAHRLGGGDTCGTILRYNAGHGAKRMNRISAAYCSKVKRHMREA